MACGTLACLEVTNGEAHDDYGLVIGLRNSHDKSFPAAIALGSGTFVCDNLAFSSEVTIARRHTRFIERDLPRVVHTAVGRLADMRGRQDERIRTYKETELTDPAAHDLVVRAVDAEVLPVTQLPAVLGEWRSPRHAEFAAAGKTAWRSLQCLQRNLEGPPSGRPAPPLASTAWFARRRLRTGRVARAHHSPFYAWPLDGAQRARTISHRFTHHQNK